MRISASGTVARRLAVLVALLCAASGMVSGDAGERSGARAAASSADPGQALAAFLRVAAVAGREQPAAAFIREQLGTELPVRSDALGNVTVTFGSGAPRRLVACPLGEPGFVVSRIEDDGYLRLAAAGGQAPTGTLWEQAHEGQVVWVAGARGEVPGGVAARSIHLQRERADDAAPPFTIADAFLDVGAENAAEVAELGIRLLDPVALERRPARLAHDLVAGPSARVKGACLAAVDAARRFRRAPGSGTVVFAWTAQDLINRAGIDYLLRRHGPFSQLAVLGWGFGWERHDGQERPLALPPPGSGPLAAGNLGGKVLTSQAAAYLEPRLRPAEKDLYPARIGYLGLPASYAGSPVETVAVADLRRLSSCLLSLLDSVPPQAPGDAERPTPPPPSQPSPAARPTPPGPGERRHAVTASLLASLVARYGVSGDEAAVREAVRAQLPAWAHPIVDKQGNLSITFGGRGAPAAASEPRLFMAHLDEVGFRVGEVLADGRLKLQVLGGLQSTLWEGQAALVHGQRGPVPGVFEPRPDWLSADRRSRAGDLTVFLGAHNPQEAAALGIRVGSGVTMPKQLLRLGRHRALARSMDDRVGSTALLLALRRLDPAKLQQPVTFAWTTREEVGLVGAIALSRTFAAARRVYPVDTLVSSDSPRESRRVAYVPLGHGAALRAFDDASSAPRELVDRVLALGRRRGIPLQLGMTGGATDGIPFLAGDAAVLPLSWPGRYSHSPVEVADLRDVEALVDLVVALAAAQP